MSILTQSGRFVKRPIRTRQVVAALRRAKAAPATAKLTHARQTYSLTPAGAAQAIANAERLLTEAAGEVQDGYAVTEEGDHLRFSRPGPCDFARVSLPAAGQPMLCWRGSGARWPEAAFVIAAGLWLAARQMTGQPDGGEQRTGGGGRADR